jgi:hypothetical protein
MIEAYITGGSCIKVSRQDGLCLELPESIEIELSTERREVGMLEVLRQNVRGKLVNVLDYKVVSLLGPGSNLWIAAINHVECFCTEDEESIICECINYCPERYRGVSRLWMGNQ